MTGMVVTSAMGFLAKPLNALIGAGAAVAVGIGVGVAGHMWWDHHAPFGWGLGQRLDKSKAALTVSRADLKACNIRKGEIAAETWKWKGVYDRLETRRETEQRDAAKALAARSAFYAGQCKAAFNSGVTAGRILGGAKSDATVSNSGDGGVVGGAGGVRDDFRDAWAAGAVGRDGPGD